MVTPKSDYISALFDLDFCHLKVKLVAACRFMLSQDISLIAYRITAQGEKLLGQPLYIQRMRMTSSADNFLWSYCWRHFVRQLI